MSVRTGLLRLTELGVDESTSPSDAKFIVLTNSICLLALLVSVVYLGVNFSIENPGVVPYGPPLLSAAVYAFPLWLNRKKRYWAATTSMVLAALATQLGFTLTFGTASGNHFYILPLLGGVTLVYSPEHRRTAIAFVLAGLVAFTVLVLWGEEFGALVNVDSGTSRVYYALALTLAAVLIALVSYYESRRTEIAEEALKAAQAQMIEAENQAVLGRLVAGLLHEVNTPLGSLRSAAGSIKGAVARSFELSTQNVTSGSEEAESARRAMEVCSRLCEAIETSTGRVSTVVEGLRQFVRLDEADRKPVDVREALDVTLSLLGPSLENRIEVMRSYPRALSEVLCFPAKLNRAFLALLENAVNAIEERGVIRIAVRESEGRVEIEILDDGKGIPAALMPSIFELGLTRKGGRVGLRLGLPLTKRNVEEISGRLTLESTEGKGTTVRMSLPVQGRGGSGGSHPGDGG